MAVLCNFREYCPNAGVCSEMVEGGECTLTDIDSLGYDGLDPTDPGSSSPEDAMNFCVATDSNMDRFASGGNADLSARWRTAAQHKPTVLGGMSIAYTTESRG